MENTLAPPRARHQKLESASSAVLEGSDRNPAQDGKTQGAEREMAASAYTGTLTGS